MSLLQASNIIPSTLAPAGKSTVAVAENVNIQWQINGTSPLSWYQIDILENNADSALVHTTGTQYVTGGAYGTDGKGNITPFTYNPASTTWQSWGLTDGNSYKLKLIQVGGNATNAIAFTPSGTVSLTQGNAYQFYCSITHKWYVFVSPATVSSLSTLHLLSGNLVIINYTQTLLDSGHPPLKYATATIGNSGSASAILGSSAYANVFDCILQNFDVVFNTRSIPSITIAAIADDTIKDITYTFTATYSQAQYDSLNWVRWILAKPDGTVVDDTGKITTGLLSYTYDGFRNDTNYTLGCTIETQNGVQAGDIKTFSVEYTVNNDTEGVTSVCTYDSDGSALLRWSLSSGYSGLSTGTITYNNSFVNIPANGTVSWLINFSAPYEIAWFGKWTVGAGARQILKLNNAQTLIFDDSSIRFNGNAVFVPNDALTKAKYITVLIREIGIALWFFDAAGSRLYNCDTISYFSTGLVDTVSSIMLYGSQSCDWLCITSNTLYAFQYSSIQQRPPLDSDTIFLANFDGDLTALGWSATGGSSSSTWHIYREDLTTGNILHIAATSGLIEAIKDYGIRSNADYRYTILLRTSSNVWVNGVASSQICKRMTSYYLYEAVEDQNDSNAYIVVKKWRFGNNYNGGSVSNNNAPQFLANFTKYPLRQSSTVAAKSGTLTALLNNFAADNSYEDTAAQMQELYDLSLTRNHVFLKDTKGNLYEVHTSAPISQTINTATGVQEVTVNISWQEIADASNVTLYGAAPIIVVPIEFTADGTYEAPIGKAYSPVTVSVEPTVYEDLLEDTWGS